MRRWATAACLVLFGGCAEELDPPSLVKSLRILTVVAEPPIAAPGDDIRLSALVVDPDEREDLRFTWSACSRFEALAGQQSLQYGEEPPRQGCVDGEPGTFPIESHGDEGIVPGVLTRTAYEDLEVLAATYGDQLPPDVLRFVVETSGLPFTIGVTIRAGSEELLRSFKRVLLFTGEPRGTNPPPPRFSIDGTWVSGRETDEPWTCLPEEGTAPVVDRGTTVVLSPDPEDESWRESYQIIDATGAVVTKEEDAYYAWFSTAGRFGEVDTRAPLRDDTWKAPRAPGTYPIWLVVRDGHGGTSACRADVEVR